MMKDFLTEVKYFLKFNINWGLVGLLLFLAVCITLILSGVGDTW